MLAVRQYGPRDLRVEEVPEPGLPGRGEVLVRVKAVGICGSDLHMYREGGIGDTSVQSPLILGHECAGVVEEVGPDAFDGNGAPLPPGIRVAIDPATPCGRCEMCERGHPNLCVRLHFGGLSPYDGCLRERMIVQARTCFPIPDSIDDVSGALLEPLGVAIHAVRLSHLQIRESASVHGAGPIGLLILQVARRAGASPLFVVEKLPWRLAAAAQLHGVPIDPSRQDPQRTILDMTGGRGVDAAFEAGWADTLVQEAADAVRPGGRVVLVGIPTEDRLFLKHSAARRKGLTLVLSRRMKHTYPAAIDLVAKGSVDVQSIVSHRFPLEQAPEAFALNEAYRDNVVKVAIVL